MLRKHILLTEIHRIQTLLLESRVDVLKGKFTEKVKQLLSSSQEYVSQISSVDRNIVANAVKAATETKKDDIVDTGEEDEIFINILASYAIDKIIEADPNPVKKNSEWLLQIYTRGKMPFEDLDKATDYLTRFEEQKKKKLLPPEKRNLRDYPDLPSLYLAVKSSDDELIAVDDSERKKAQSESEIVFKNNDYIIIVPKTEFAAAYYGRNSEWCTAWGYDKGRYPTRTNHFEHYNRQGPIFIIHQKSNGETWQFHFPTNDFEDMNGSHINLDRYREEHPDIAEYFEKRFSEGYDIIRNEPDYIVYYHDNHISFRRTPFGLHKNNGGSFTIKVEDDGSVKSFNTDGIMNLMRMAGKDFQEELKSIFKEHEIGGSKVSFAFSDYDLYYNPRKGWGTFDEVAEPSTIGITNGRWFFLSDGHDVHGAYEGLGEVSAEIENGVIDFYNVKFPKEKDKYTQNKFMEHMTSFMLKYGAKRISYSSKISVEDFPEYIAEIIIEEQPSLATLGMLAQAKGIESVEVKNKVLDRLEGDEHEGESEIHAYQHFIKLPNGETAIVMEKYDEVRYLADDVPGNIKEYMDDDFIIEPSSIDEDYHKDDLINNLSETNRKVIGEYIFNTYEEEYGEGSMEEEYPDFDPKDTLSISQVYDENNGIFDELKSALQDAVWRGYEAGMQDEKDRAVHSAIEDNDYIFFDYGDSIRKELRYDTKCYIAVPLKEIISVLEKDRENLEYYSYWMSYRYEMYGDKVEVESPYYGWSEYSEDVAQESFEEALSEYNLLK